MRVKGIESRNINISSRIRKLHKLKEMVQIKIG